MNSLSSRSNADVVLVTGERLVWSSPRGSSKLRLSSRQLLGLVLVSFYSVLILIALLLFVNPIHVAIAVVLGVAGWKLLEQMLLTVLAGPTAAADMEPHLLHLVRHPDSGHSIVIDLGEAALAVEGHTLSVRMEERTHQIDLRQADAIRAAQYLVTQRRTHPMR